MKAVVFIDVQKDFIDGALRNKKAIEVTPKIVDFAKECVEKDYKLYATRDTHEKTKLNYHFEGNERVDEYISGYLSTLEGKKLPVEHCIEGTDGWMIDDRLMDVLDGKCTFVQKPTFGSFDLAKVIQEEFEDENKILDEIIICGFVTDICVISNALLLRAKFPNTKITVMKDLCAGTIDENHESALKVMTNCLIDII
jgi:nicotinamidase-related amidase